MISNGIVSILLRERASEGSKNDMRMINKRDFGKTPVVVRLSYGYRDRGTIMRILRHSMTKRGFSTFALCVR